MAITVFTLEGDHATYEKGADWFVDELGRLYVRDEQKKHIAVYNETRWDSAADGEPRMSEEQLEREKTRRIEAEAKAKAEAEFNARRGQL